MGYYAAYNGNIELNNPTQEAIEAINETFTAYEESENVYRVDNYDKYYDDAVLDTLDIIEPYTKSGVIEYHGEDDSHWRFVFKDGHWNDESGTVIYESDNLADNDKEEFLGQIIDVMQDCLADKHEEIIKDSLYDEIKDKLEKIMQDWNVFS